MKWWQPLDPKLVGSPILLGDDSKHSVNVSISSPEHRFVGIIS